MKVILYDMGNLSDIIGLYKTKPDYAGLYKIKQVYLRVNRTRMDYRYGIQDYA